MKKIITLLVLACAFIIGNAQSISRIYQMKKQLYNHYPTAKIQNISNDKIKTNYPKLTEKYRKELKNTSRLVIWKSFDAWLEDSTTGFKNEDCGYSANVVNYLLKEKKRDDVMYEDDLYDKNPSDSIIEEHNVIFYFDRNNKIINSSFELSHNKWVNLISKDAIFE